LKPKQNIICFDGKLYQITMIIEIFISFIE